MKHDTITEIINNSNEMVKWYLNDINEILGFVEHDNPTATICSMQQRNQRFEVYSHKIQPHLDMIKLIVKTRDELIMNEKSINAITTGYKYVTK